MLRLVVSWINSPSPTTATDVYSVPLSYPSKHLLSHR